LAGTGGFAGSLAPAHDGFLAITTNTGHEADGTDARWAFDDVERQVDYGYLAVHETAEVGKALARAY
jgi:feruloyl esterase